MSAPKTKRGRRGPPSDAHLIARAVSKRSLEEQLERAAKAVFARVERLTMRGEEIPISLLGAARMFTEWHTDYRSIDVDEDDTTPAAKAAPPAAPASPTPPRLAAVPTPREGASS